MRMRISPVFAYVVGRWLAGTAAGKHLSDDTATVSSDPASKKKRLEDEPFDGVALEHQPEVEDVLGLSVALSTTTSKGNSPSNEIQRLRSSSSTTDQLIIGPINKRDPTHGPGMAKTYFKEGSFQPQDLNFPQVDGRKFRPEWYKIFSWLEYSILTDKAFCFVCRLFYNSEENNAEDVFTLTGFSKWKKAVNAFKKHENSSSHRISNIKLNSLKEADKSGTVIEKVHQQYSEEVKENRLYLEALCESLIFCGRQSIALRGHDESTDSKNRGNFLELMKLRSIDNCYTSPTFQNELLSIIGEQIKMHIAKEVKEAKIFAIIADETQNIAKHEQVAIVLRYVNDKLEIHESFVGFYRTKRADGVSLANELKNVLISLDLNLKYLRAQCYDGASNMRGPYKGVAAIIMQEAPMAINTFFVLQSLYNFIAKSTKRHAVFEEIQKTFQSHDGGTVTLKSLSDTRWACRVEAVRSLLDNFDATLATLREIYEKDNDSGGQANALLKNIEDFNFVFDLLLLKRVLSQCDVLSKTLQSSSVTYEIVKSVKNSTLDVLKSFRTHEFFTKLFDHCTDITDKCGFKTAQLPRNSRIPLKIGGGSKTPFESVEQYYKVSILWPVIDILIEEIEAILQENILDVLNHLWSSRWNRCRHSLCAICV
ncbi:zinc finger MYM-type protein 1-like [Daktulosphaira vitifoliae]|uniref:zinc finger MYM-type protein 1-like n=1 Tax=Daktulosphaira vitifoliae TaxID=58002 RepID=UPI0021A9F147|nr:zinc finger MYM-type protein 1-like [Daktulosphaira vitifoliae]